jgi:hypothetical protein
MSAGPGRFRRRIEIATRVGIARAVVEDDFHHFRVEVKYEGGIVRHVRGHARRFPWATCPAAYGPLTQLVGMPLSPNASAVREQSEQRLQCTHIFDLAGLAIAAAARNVRHRRYEAAVPDRIDGETQPRLFRDKEPVLSWQLDGDIIRSPKPYVGISVRAGFVPWAIQNLTQDEAEAAIVLRRALFVSNGRGRDLDAQPTAAAKSGCYTQQPERVASAFRVIGSTRDFTHYPSLADPLDTQWLSFDI